jgi:hypothetical protein
MLSVVEAQHIQPLDGVVFRITDHQGYQATERWTRNLAEQVRLEALINSVKPPLPVDWPEAETGQPLPVHSLLLTPFRYPPLANGSRFSPPDTRELFYGARSLATVLAERAFHALRLLEGSPLPTGRSIQRQQTSFSVQIQTPRGVRLQECLDDQKLAEVTDPCSYAVSQSVGRRLRELGVQVFEVPSVRVPREAACVGVLTPYAFVSTPFDFQDWTLEVRADGVTFASFGQSQVVSLAREQFLVAGRWPGPEPLDSHALRCFGVP